MKETPLIEAVRAGNHRQALALLMRGSSLMEPTRDGDTAYDLAMKSNDPQMVGVFRGHLVHG